MRVLRATLLFTEVRPRLLLMCSKRSARKEWENRRRGSLGFGAIVPRCCPPPKTTLVGFRAHDSMFDLWLSDIPSVDWILVNLQILLFCGSFLDPLPPLPVHLSVIQWRSSSTCQHAPFVPVSTLAILRRSFSMSREHRHKHLQETWRSSESG